MNIKRPATVENVGFNMTPMIDIVFQLIIFLMLATEISQIELADLILPKASDGIVDRNPDKDRLIVNISHCLPNCPHLKYTKTDIVNVCSLVGHWEMLIHGKKIDRDALRTEFLVAGPDRPVLIGQMPAHHMER